MKVWKRLLIGTAVGAAVYVLAPKRETKKIKTRVSGKPLLPPSIEGKTMQGTKK